MDTATLRIVARSPVTAIGALAASRSGKFLYMSTGSAITVFDTTQNAFTGSLPIGGVTAIAFSPDGSTPYAAAKTALDVVDTSTGQVTGWRPGLGGARGQHLRDCDQRSERHATDTRLRRHGQRRRLRSPLAPLYAGYFFGSGFG